jgi:DMSO/TMAO reductase YedYZ molybdopterin-dependent catalytic subunit
MKHRRLPILGLVAIMVIAASTLFVVACGEKADNATTVADETTTSMASEATSADDTDTTGASGTDATTAADAASDGIVISGLVDTPMTFTSMDSDYMYWTTITADHPTEGSKEFEGVLLSDIFAYVGIQDDATTVVITGADGSSVDVALADLSGKDALVTIDDDGAMSAIMPDMDATYWVENIVGMEFK